MKLKANIKLFSGVSSNDVTDVLRCFPIVSMLWQQEWLKRQKEKSLFLARDTSTGTGSKDGE